MKSDLSFILFHAQKNVNTQWTVTLLMCAGSNSFMVVFVQEKGAEYSTDSDI